MNNKDKLYSSFTGYRHIASGPLRTVLKETKTFYDSTQTPDERNASHHPENLLFFHHGDGRQLDFDLSGSLEDVLSRIQTREPSPVDETPDKPGKGRPRLGVVSKEVTLLPRHWEWLSRQPASASATLRRLVSEASSRENTSSKAKAERLGTILWTLAGNLEGFEEASRCLHRLDFEGLFGFSDKWPGDLPGFIRNWFRNS